MNVRLRLERNHAEQDQIGFPRIFLVHTQVLECYSNVTSYVLEVIQVKVRYKHKVAQANLCTCPRTTN